MPDVRFRASDGSTQVIPISVAEGPEPAPARARTIQGVSGLTAEPDTRYIDCPNLSVPLNIERITVVGSQFPTTQLKGVRDVWIEGRPDALMNSGPRSDGGDLLQIKRWPPDENGVVPEDVTIRWVEFHDVTRPAGSGAHPDGVQQMAGRRVRYLSCRFLRCDIQPLFLNHSGSASAGGGPVEDCLVEDCYVEQAPNGYATIIFGGHNTLPLERQSKRCLARNCRVGNEVRIGSGAFEQGCRVENIMTLTGAPLVPGYVIG